MGTNISKLHFGLIKINKPYAWEQSVSLKTIPSELIKLERTFRDRVRFYNFWFQIKYIKKMEIEGAFAELGVYKGITAKVIHLWIPIRRFYLLIPSMDLILEI